MHKHAKASPAQEAQKSTCTSISEKEHIAECVLSAIILRWDMVGGKERETTKRPRNTTQVKYSGVALSKIRLHYLPYSPAIFSWCGFVTNFCFLLKYINPLFALDVNNVGRMLAMARPITWLGADGETEPNILSFPTCLSLYKDILFNMLHFSTFSSFSEDILFW